MIFRRKKIEDEEKTIRILPYVQNQNVRQGVSSIIGTRTSQQDAWCTGVLTDKKLTYAVVCDGMGGMEDGGRASQEVTDYFQKEFESKYTGNHLPELLCDIAEEGDRIVSNLKNKDGSPIRSGTTLAAVVIEENRLSWVSVGDSSIYLLREGSLYSLVREHNYEFMAEYRKNDSTFEFNPEVRPDALVSYLGAGGLPFIEVSKEPYPLEHEDIVILCSDGLYKSLNKEQIAAMFLSENQDMNRVAEMLTMAAEMNSTGSQDNTTVIVLKYIDQSKIMEVEK